MLSNVPATKLQRHILMSKVTDPCLAYTPWPEYLLMLNMIRSRLVLNLGSLTDIKGHKVKFRFP